MPDRLDLDLAFALTQIDALVIAYPELAEDEQFRADMVEGATTTHEVSAKIVDRMQDAEAKVDGISGLITEWTARKARFARRAEAMRVLVFRLMDRAGLRKIELPAATLSIRAGVPRVIITDETALPPDCVRIRTEPDRIAIKERMARGEQIPGAEMSNSEPVLSVRIK
jgi:Gp157 protein